MTISSAAGDRLPAACTLPSADRPIRVAEFDRFLRTSVRTVRRRGPRRLELLVDARAEAVARELAGRESECCSFFGFDFAATADGVVMGVEVPPPYVSVLEALAERAVR
ncbi:hypothetical protein [Nocardia sp. NPDC050435]|uniref:hypothetical protein n=1 Tax=Nocardia sp. NPDC050435 TaxID=3155040 RepID=UPI0034018475